MLAKKLCLTCKKRIPRKSNLKRHVKKFRDVKRPVRQLAETKPRRSLTKVPAPTTNVRKFIIPEDIKDEIDMLVMTKQLEDWGKVSTNSDGYLKLKFEYLQRKINKQQLKIISNTSSSVTKEYIFNMVVEDAFELITTVRRMVWNRRKCMGTRNEEKIGFKC